MCLAMKATTACRVRCGSLLRPPAPALAAVTARPRSSVHVKGAFQAIADNFLSLDQVQAALRRNGLESSNLIVAVDFTKSNEWTGTNSFGGRSLHWQDAQLNPYEQAISVIAKTLSAFDDDGLIPCYGFGDATTSDNAVFSFFPGDKPAEGLDALLQRYRELVPNVKLAGPTSFAPAIKQAMKIVEESGNQYHILLLIADGQVTRSEDMPRGQLSNQEKATIAAIVEASSLPLSIVMVGVGDGPWDVMKEFDDKLPKRVFDNFQFVEYTAIAARYKRDPKRLEAVFATNALMEIPDQFRFVQRLNLLGAQTSVNPRVRCRDPPGPPPKPYTPPSPTSTPPAASSYSTRSQPATSSSDASGLVQRLGSWFGTVTSGANKAPAGAKPKKVDPMFICPITLEVMQDPVIAADGQTYERSGITQWLKTHDTSPLTGTKLLNKKLVPNDTLRNWIKEELEQ